MNGEQERDPIATRLNLEEENEVQLCAIVLSPPANLSCRPADH
jgi:hypothetical protein